MPEIRERPISVSGAIRERPIRERRVAEPPEEVPGMFSGEYSAPLSVGNEAVQSTIAPGESMPHALGRQAIGGVKSAAKSAVEMGKAMLSPEDTWLGRAAGPGAALVRPHIEEGKKAYQAAKEGRYSEAIGHSIATLTPGIGPMISSATERAATGTVGPAAELATAYAGGKAAPKVYQGAKAGVEKTVGGARAVAGWAADRNLERTLDATTKKLKAISSEDVVPGIHDRKMKANSLEDLASQGERGATKHGEAITASLDRHTAAGIELPVKPLIDRLEGLKNSSDFSLKNSKTGEVIQDRSGAVAQIQAVQDMLGKFGDRISPKDLAATRRFLDDAVAKKKMAFLVDETKGFDAIAQEKSANLLRDEINAEFPDVAFDNNEYHFHKSLQTVAESTIQRRASQSKIVSYGGKLLRGGTVGTALGGVAGGPIGVIADFAHDTPAYRTRAARVEHKFSGRGPTTQVQPPRSGRQLRMPTAETGPNAPAGQQPGPLFNPFWQEKMPGPRSQFDRQTNPDPMAVRPSIEPNPVFAPPKRHVLDPSEELGVPRLRTPEEISADIQTRKEAARISATEETAKQVEVDRESGIAAKKLQQAEIAMAKAEAELAAERARQGVLRGEGNRRRAQRLAAERKKANLRP